MSRRQTQAKEEVETSVKSLHSIQIAITDKENLHSKTVIQSKSLNLGSAKGINTKKTRKRIPIKDRDKNVELQNNINKAKSEKNDGEDKIAAKDLAIGNDGEGYWQKKAENERIALAAALQKNENLHKKICELEYENNILNQTVDEGRNLVEVLSDMVEKEESSAENSDEGESSSIEKVALDEENLTSKDVKDEFSELLTDNKQERQREAVKDSNKNNDVELKKNNNTEKSEKTDDKNTITVKDLTDDNPSENYWKSLAESRINAIEATSKENLDLHNKFLELQYENSRLREMVEEIRNLVEVLTEMLEEKEGASAESADEEGSTKNNCQDHSSSDCKEEV